MSSQDVEPDPRWTLANERTFLAWNQTALALIAAGLTVTQALPRVDVPGGRLLIGLPPIILGGVIGTASYFRWTGNDRAMRSGTPLPRSVLPLIFAVAVVAGALASLVVAIRGNN